MPSSSSMHGRWRRGVRSARNIARARQAPHKRRRGRIRRMPSLSISHAWEETRALIARDGKLAASVALAMIALPVTIVGLVSPGGMASTRDPLWVEIVMIVCSLIVLSGQLALIRLALPPSTSVGAAIQHGLVRMPIYLATAVLIAVVLLLAALPLVVILAAAGAPTDEAQLVQSPIFLMVCFIYFLLLCFIAVRMIMSSPAASAEPIGPIAIIRRSWSMTAGHWWKLFAFLLLFLVGAGILLIAVGTVAGTVVSLFLGPLDPLSASALITSLIEALFQAAVSVIFAIMLARIYAQLSGRREVQPSVPSSGT